MKYLAAICLLFAASALAQASGAYNLTLHVVSSHIDQDCGVTRGETTCRPMQILRATVDGRLFELRSKTFLSKGIIALGDYQARLADDEHKPSNEFTREYTLRFPDGSTRNFEVVGEEQAAQP